MAQLDPYKILGVAPSAAHREVVAAYRKKAKACHPDLFPDNERAREEFKVLTECYNLIDTAKKQKAYNAKHYAKKAASPRKTATGSPIKRTAPRKRAFEAKPLVNVSRDGNTSLRKDKKPKKSMVFVAAALFIILLIGFVREHRANQREYAALQQTIDALYDAGDVRRGVLFKNTVVEHATAMHQLKYRYKTRNHGLKTHDIFIKKKAAMELVLIDPQAAPAPTADAAEGDIEPLPKTRPFDVLYFPKHKAHIPLYFLEIDTISKEMQQKIVSFVECIKEASAPCTISVGEPEPEKPE